LRHERRKGAFVYSTEPSKGGSANPIDVLQAVALENGWSFEEHGADEIILTMRGSHTDYRVFFTWMQPLEVFHVACVFELKVPESRRAELQRLIAGINEQLWFGHFDLWTPDGTVLFRQALLLVGGITASAHQCEVLLGTALDSCERYYPAFQCVLVDRSAGDAINAISLETAGEA
jgi:hypothetical protein